MSEDKFIMFRNRLEKVHRHLGKLAKKKGVGAFRLYDHDLPEFPYCIEIYESNIYVAEYKRRHGMSEEEHDQWMEKSIGVICEVLKSTPENIFFKIAPKKARTNGPISKNGREKIRIYCR